MIPPSLSVSSLANANPKSTEISKHAFSTNIPLCVAAQPTNLFPHRQRCAIVFYCKSMRNDKLS